MANKQLPSAAHQGANLTTTRVGEKHVHDYTDYAPSTPALAVQDLQVGVKQLSYMTAMSKVSNVSRFSKMTNKLGPKYPE